MGAWNSEICGRGTFQTRTMGRSSMMNHMEKMTDLLKEKDILNALQNMADSCESHMLLLVIFRKRDSPMMKFNFCTPTHFVMKKRKKKYLHSIYIYFFLSI